MPIRDLASHQAEYVTVAELAEYWAVSRLQIQKRIEVGSLAAIRLGSRIYRIRTSAALEFERRSSVTHPESETTTPESASERTDKLPPAKIGFQRVRGSL